MAEDGERRQQRRFSLVAHVKIWGASHRLLVVNLSLTGLLMRGQPEGATVGVELFLMLSAEGSDDSGHIEMRGHVVRVDERGVAVRFGDCSENDKVRLAELVARLAENPGSLPN